MDVGAFVARWSHLEGGAERANYAMFLSELCDVIGVHHPDPAGATTERNDYVFERFVRRADGTHGRIDLYKKDCFVLEAKQSREVVGSDKYVAGVHPQLDLGLPQGTQPSARPARRQFDVLMVNARRQAEDYARELPQDHGWPPFVLVCDVGHCIEVYSDFRRMGKYEQFPDRHGYRLFLEDLQRPEVRALLRAIWQEPHSLDPTARAAKATREIAARLAQVSKGLEARGQAAEEVSHFLMRCLFTMFAEDVGLLPSASFEGLLRECVDHPDSFAPLLADLWKTMDAGGFAVSIRSDVKRFNGALFKEARVLPLRREEIGELLAASRQDWREVEPAIFGTLLEQALDKSERQRLGAHYTPRAYVERLVTATIIEPLREDWAIVLGAVEDRRAEGDQEGAIALAKAFHTKLCSTRVLDPACGTGNFLYVSMDLMKRLEAEVLETLDALGWHEQGLRWLEGQAVDPHQFLGLEKNPRAAAIAELVLWIGFLQLHFRNSEQAPSEPVLQAFRNINFGMPGGYDAILTWDGAPVPVLERRGDATREIYPQARRPDWPSAEFIVGNPPFTGGKDIRARLGDGYAETLWRVHRHMNPSADLVMYWWDRAAELLVQKGSPLRRFGFVTTNSITQEFSRRVMKRRMEGKSPISLLFAIPNHPWTKGVRDAAAVRIAMTVAAKAAIAGTLREVILEARLDTDEPEVTFKDCVGRINSDLTVGADVAAARPLVANGGISSRGMSLHGKGFILSLSEAEHLGLYRRPGLEQYIRSYRNGRDLTAKPRDAFVIDLYGLSSDQVRDRFPEVYQHLLSTVKPDREAEFRRSGTKDAETYAADWWVFGKPRQELRPALQGLDRYIVTVETMRHRIFQFLDAKIVPDNKLVCVALDDAAGLAVLSSKIHVAWSLRAGGRLGVGNDPVWAKSRCFDPFPFPNFHGQAGDELRKLGEELDKFRKERLAELPGLTLTKLYNVLEGVRVGRELEGHERHICEAAFVLILNELHDQIDQATLHAYGWPRGLSDEDLLAGVLALNAERAAEERRGTVRWLRPAYQPGRAGLQSIGGEQTTADLQLPENQVRPSFPRDPLEQSAAVAAVLAAALGPVDVNQVAAAYRKDRRTERKIAGILAAFARTGFATSRDGGKTFVARRAA